MNEGVDGEQSGKESRVETGSNAAERGPAMSEKKKVSPVIQAVPAP